jgi:ribosomal protein L7/L12
MQVSEIYENLLNRVIALSLALDSERTARITAESKASERSVNVGDVYTLMSAMASDRTFDAIKAYRNLTGMGLKESKDAVEAVMQRERVA